MIKGLIFLCIVLCGCRHSKNVQQTNDSTNIVNDSSLYKVYKIDSVNSYYLIYARKNSTLYKIVSKKNILLGNKKIYDGGEYDFKLNSIWNKGIMIGGVNVSPSVTPHVTCLSFDDTTKICLEKDSINDLHQAENLQGLYLLQR